MKKIIILFFVICSALNGFAQSLDVLTYNIKYDNPSDSLNNWENRKAFLISQLKFYGPDIFGTQEGLFHQLQDIQNGLKDYAFFGVGRDNGNEKGEFTAIFYNTEKYILLSEDTFWLSKTSSKPSIGWDAALPRICTYGLFKIKGSNKQFYVFNTHFDHVGESAREESARLILSKIDELNVNDRPVILMGDFNLEEHAPGIQSILKKMSDTHILAGKNSHGPKGTYNGFDFTKPVDRRIDYIFTSQKTIKILKSGILSDSKDCRYPSDHFPVLARLMLGY